mgnify:CR=1 FL=1
MQQRDLYLERIRSVERVLDFCDLLARSDQHPNAGVRQLRNSEPHPVLQLGQLHLGRIRLVERVLATRRGVLARIHPRWQLRPMR